MTPFYPIAVAHREMAKLQKEQDKILQGLQDDEEDSNTSPLEVSEDEPTGAVPEMTDIAKHMIHSINIE